MNKKDEFAINRLFFVSKYKTNSSSYCFVFRKSEIVSYRYSSQNRNRLNMLKVSKLSRIRFQNA